MGMNRDKIKSKLRDFGAVWSRYNGIERSEAQTFCNEFFECFDMNRREVGANFEQVIPDDSTRADLVWGDRLLIEMKRPSEANLTKHYNQVYHYWIRINPSPKFVIISNFQTIEIHDPNHEYGRPLSTIPIIEIDKHMDSLLFMLDQKPLFHPTQTELTKKAADLTIGVYRSLLDRGYDVSIARLFILQCVFAMFAEDVALLPRQHFTDSLLTCIKKDQKTGDVLTLLFQRLNESDDRKRKGRDIPYINGGLFKDVFPVDLDKVEMEQLLEAANSDWSYIRPEIFGTLFEHSMSDNERSMHGVHYTSEFDIQKIVQPTIVQPWMSIIDGIHNLADLGGAKKLLADYRVLDASCGSGNFLFIAYRELKRIERMMHDREIELKGVFVRKNQKFKAIFPIENLYGIDLDNFAVMLARVTLWIGQQILNKEFEIDEKDLPLPDLCNIQCTDALFCDWPKGISAYIGNPPFLGAQRMRSRLGDEYINRLRNRFPNHRRQADFCTYFFRKVHDEMNQEMKAGLVGTNTIRENNSRASSLDYIVLNHGCIYNAWSSYKWAGDAKVHVSVVNWKKDAAFIQCELDGKKVQSISTRLTEAANILSPQKICSPWSRLGYQGVILRGKGFILNKDEALQLVMKDEKNRSVVKPYLSARALQSNSHSYFDKYVIDFGGLSLEEAESFEDVMKIVKERVYPERSKLKQAPDNSECKLYWWRFHKARAKLRDKIKHLEQYIAVARHAKQPYFTMIDRNVIPDNGVVVIASSDLYLCGILSSHYHNVWAWVQGSTLKGDLRYTPTTILETFPFPSNVKGSLTTQIAETTRVILNERTRLMESRHIGLTKLYSGSYPSLIKLHTRLDQLVCEAYGWSWKEVNSDEEIRRRLLALNLEQSD
jgi:hypothetical protein